MYLPGNRIALIDFGMVGRLSPARRRQIIDLLAGLAGHDEEAMLEVLLDWRGDDFVDEARLAADLGEFAFDYADMQLKDLKIGVHNKQLGFKIAKVRLRPTLQTSHIRRPVPPHSSQLPDWNFFASETCDRSLSAAFRAQLSWHYSPPAMRVSGPIRTATMSFATCSPPHTPASNRWATLDCTTARRAAGIAYKLPPIANRHRQ
jgi:predicted unusual protein kinase regulating ubiquinone biosynthesis (AarF/ABC1/UbiB family)